MNKDIIEDKWEQLKIALKKVWRELSEEELNKMHGQRDKLVQFIQKSYNEEKEDIENKLTQILDNLK